MNLFRFFILIISFLACSFKVHSHPHSFIYLKTDFITQNNTLNQIKFKWTMDELTSSYLKLDYDNDPKKTLHELIANVMINHYFSEFWQIKDSNKIKVDFYALPTNSNLIFINHRAVFDFTLSLKNLLELTGAHLELITYEKSFYVDMHYVNKSDITINNELCDLSVMSANPDQNTHNYAKSLDESDEVDKEEYFNLGKLFAQTVKITCK